MTIKIQKSGPFALGGIDVRDFKEGDVHVLAPEHEKELIDAGVAVEAADDDVAKALPAGDPRVADALKRCEAPQAVDTAAVAARVVADGVTHDSEGSLIPGSTNSEGPEVTHAADLVNSAAVEAGDEAKEKQAVEAEAAAKAEAEAAEKAEAEARAEKDEAKHGKAKGKK